MEYYQNPVYPNYFADPFVWKHDGRYYAVGTGPLEGVAISTHVAMSSALVDGQERAFPLLESDTLSHWRFVNGALLVPEHLRGGEFWAPETAFDGKYFYLYYSAAVEELKHELRVARSSLPTGPYKDIGRLMFDTRNCPFAIDAHAFQDDDGEWYLFYARDFLDATAPHRAGTALVVDRLVDMTRLAGEEQVVLRARSDWQLFKAQRSMYGRVLDWHTVEGPCIRKHDGLYFCFYSGGCFENASYGIDYGVAENVMGPYRDDGNESGARVLRTAPGRLIGPGHHSIVEGPDGLAEFVVYHAWDAAMTARRMCIDKLVWTSEGPRCLGPTWTRQELGEPFQAVEAKALNA